MSLILALMLLLPTDLPAVVGGEFYHSVKPGESLTAIGARYGLPLEHLASINGLSPKARLEVDQLLLVDNRHIVPEGYWDGIVINIPQRMLFLFSQGELVTFYPVAVGSSGWPTVRGRFEIVRKETDPVWDVPPSIQQEMRDNGRPVVTRVPPSPQNPLGLYYMTLSAAGYGIHGTNAPASIFSFQTHGCIRLHPDDIADLYVRVTIGTPVEIIYKPVLIADAGERIWIEVHPDVYRQGPDPVTVLSERLPAFHQLPLWNLILAMAKDRAGIAKSLPIRHYTTEPWEP
jgi:L,D-transpeptidase ErfK/SrfK